MIPIVMILVYVGKESVLFPKVNIDPIQMKAMLFLDIIPTVNQKKIVTNLKYAITREVLESVYYRALLFSCVLIL